MTREELLARIREKAQVKAPKRPAPRRHVAGETPEDPRPTPGLGEALERFLEAPGGPEAHAALVEHFGARLIEYREE